MKASVSRPADQPLAGDGWVLAEWTATGDEWQAPRHKHHVCGESWHVLEGRLCVVADGEELFAGPGECIHVPAGVVHSFRNAGEGECRYLLIMTPLTQRLIDAIHATEDRSWPALQALFEAHQAELIG